MGLQVVPPEPGKGRLNAYLRREYMDEQATDIPHS